VADAKDNRICPNCQMPYEKAGSGSLTQWLLICTCHLKDEEGSSSAASPEPLNYCSTCGKRVESGRAGTLTQWIFRADLCSCAMPSFISTAQLSNDPSEADAVEDELDALEEITIESKNFPVARYAPFRLLGKGAAGSVYLCKDRLLNKRVAVKILNHLSSELLVAFQREAKSTSQLTHSNIVKVLDFGVTDGQSPYMVLDFINGISLDELLDKGGALRIDDALPMFEQLCDALTYAHKRGLMHRDLKPSNIIIIPATSASPAVVHLIDFGVGAFKKELVDPRDSQSKTVVGTPAYMSPDQAAGLPYEATSEIYSLGCVMFETLTGQLPFVAESPLATISMHAHTPPPAMADVYDEEEFPDQMETIIATCLNKSPDDRFQTVADLRKEISELRSVVSAAQRDSEHLANREGAHRHGASGIEAGASAVSRTNFVPLAITLVILLGSVTIAFFYHQLSLLSETENAQARPVVSKDLDDGFADDEAKWKMTRGDDGKNLWNSGNSVTDEDIKLLAKETQVSAVKVNINYDVTGTGFKDLAHLPIHEIEVQSGVLNDDGLRAISKIKSLEWLTISIASGITLDGVKSLSELPRLAQLKLVVSVVPTGSFDVFAQMHQLKGLSFFDSKNVTAAGVAKLVKGAPKIRFLDLSGTEVGDEIIPVVSQIKSLEEVRCADLPITDKNLEMFTRMPKLQRLWISKTNITDKGLQQLAQCKGLRLLEISRCEKVTPEGIAEFKKVRRTTKVVHSSH